MAENLEKSSKSEQFRVLDPAQRPEKPFKPNPKKILGVSFMMGLAVGFGLAFLREFFDPTFWSHKELENFSELPVLVSIPIIQTQKERSRAKLKLAATVCIILAMSSTLLYAMYVLWKKSPGLLPIPL